MTKIYFKYFIKNFLSLFCIVFMALLSLIWLTQSLRFISIITNQGVSIFSFLKLSVMLIVPVAYIIIPISLVLSTLYFLNTISNDKELVILRACGLSNFQISKPILCVALITCVISYSISLYFLPKAYREFKEMQDLFRNKYIALLLEEGVFNSQVKNFTVYIDSSDDEGKFKGVLIYDNRKAEKPTTIIADYGQLRKTPSGPEFILYNGTQQEENKKTGHISMIFFDSYKFNLSFLSNTNTFKKYYDANELFVSQLLKKDDSGDYNREHVVHANQRLIWPLYTLVLPLLMSAIALSSNYSRKEAIVRNIVMLSFVSLFIISAISLHNLALKNYMFILPMYLNIILAGGVTLLKFMKPKQVFLKIST